MSRALQTHTDAVTGATAVSWTIGPFSDHAQVEYITVKIDASPTTSEDLTITLDSHEDGYDCILETWDPSAESTATLKQNKCFTFSHRLKAGDALVVAYNNTDANGINCVAVVDINPNQ